jgi:hypothetical protein
MQEESVLYRYNSQEVHARRGIRIEIKAICRRIVREDNSKPMARFELGDEVSVVFGQVGMGMSWKL